MRRTAIIGTGQTRHCSSHDELSQAELVREAAGRALADAGMEPAAIDAVVISNMEMFEGRAYPELWVGEAAFAAEKPCFKVATGGTSGTSACIAGFHQVASGQFDVVLVVGFEKHSEGHTQAGMAIVDPFWDRAIASGALGNFALSISQYMAQRGVSEEQAAMVAVKARRNAACNPYAHLQMPDITVEEVLDSRLLAHPIRMLDMCPQSDGACAVLIAAENSAKRYCPRPAWIESAVTRHQQPYIGDIDQRLVTMETLCNAARKAYSQAGIRNPRSDLDVAEIYEPVSYAELAWYEALGFCEDGKAGQMIELGVTAMDGDLPVNPSGGVLSSNPVGASGVIRVAEAASQVRGTAGDHQVDGVKTALATGYGVYAWADVMILRGTA